MHKSMGPDGHSAGIHIGISTGNVFVSDLDSGMECNLSRLADNTKLCVQLLEGKDGVQRGTDRLERLIRTS